MSSRNWFGLAILVLIMYLLRGSPIPGGPLVIAHRGASSLAPENTMAAVYAALTLRVAMVEVDVHRTLDGELVVIHDATVDRTTDGSGLVRRLTLAELRTLDAGSWFRRRFRQERIPTLREVLEAVKDNAILLIELKAPETEIPTIELVRELGMSQQVIVQSFNAAQLRYVKELAPEIKTVFLVSRPESGSEPIAAAEWMLNTVESVGASGVAVQYNWCTPQLIDLASELELDVYVWTVNSRSKLRRFIKAGVDGIITNKPQNALISF